MWSGLGCCGTAWVWMITSILFCCATNISFPNSRYISPLCSLLVFLCTHTCIHVNNQLFSLSLSISHSLSHRLCLSLSFSPSLSLSLPPSLPLSLSLSSLSSLPTLYTKNEHTYTSSNEVSAMTRGIIPPEVHLQKGEGGDDMEDGKENK